MAVRTRAALVAALAVTGLVATGGGMASAGGSAAAANPLLPQQLVRKVTVENTNRHLQALQRIADQNGGTRASNTRATPRASVTSPTSCGPSVTT